MKALLAICATEQRRLHRQPERSTLVTNEPSRYHSACLTPRCRDPLLSSTTSVTWEPFDLVLDPAWPGTPRIGTFGTHDFMLDKRSGSDRGIYFDACPAERVRT